MFYTQPEVPMPHSPEPDPASVAPLPLLTLWYRFLFFDWLFRDLNAARDRLERHAVLQHNRRMCRYLPTYLRRWSFMTCFDFGLGCLFSGRSFLCWSGCLALGFRLHFLLVLGLVLLHLGCGFHLCGLGSFVGLQGTIEHGNLAVSGFGAGRIVGLLDLNLFHLFAGFFLNKIDIDDVVDDNVILNVHASDKFAVVHNPPAFAVIIDDQDGEVDIEKTPGGNCKPRVIWY